jgi:hypothetical protein
MSTLYSPVVDNGLDLDSDAVAGEDLLGLDVERERPGETNGVLEFDYLRY